MKKILVLVDFSGPSVNAAAYAAALAQDCRFDQVILMANCFVPLFEQIVPSPDMIQVDAGDIHGKMEKSLGQLLGLKAELQKKLPATTTIQTHIGDQPLLRSVLDEVADESPSLVVIGSSARAPEEDCSIGRHIISLVKILPVPVLVVPHEARYQPLRDVLVAGGLEPRETLLPLFGELHYQAYSPEKKDVLKEVLEAAAGRRTQMIVALPHKHSFLYNLTHQNITHGIVMNATQPVLILK